MANVAQATGSILQAIITTANAVDTLATAAGRVASSLDNLAQVAELKSECYIEEERIRSKSKLGQLRAQAKAGTLVTE